MVVVHVRISPCTFERDSPIMDNITIVQAGTECKSQLYTGAFYEIGKSPSKQDCHPERSVRINAPGSLR